MTLKQVALLSAIVILAGAFWVALVHFGEPSSVWLWCDVVGVCSK